MSKTEERIRKLKVDNEYEYTGIHMLVKAIFVYKNMYKTFQDLLDLAYQTHLQLLKSSNNNFGIYSAKLRDFLINIDQKSHVQNKDIKNLLRVNTLKDLTLLNYTELYPSIWTDILAELNSKYNQEKLYTVNNDVKCKNCKSTNIDIQLVQTRSVDEGSTIFINCKSCGKTYKS